MRHPAQFLNRLSLRARVWLVIVLVIAGLATLTIATAVETRKQQMNALYDNLANHAAAAIAIADGYRQRAEAGEFDQAEAQKRALYAIQTMRWDDGTGYLFAIDSKLMLRMHPMRTKDIGKFVGDETDSKGFPEYRHMLEVTRRPAMASPSTCGRCRVPRRSCPR